MKNRFIQRIILGLIIIFKLKFNILTLYCGILLCKLNINKISNEKILQYEHYKISYNTSINQMNYCIYRLKITKTLCKSRCIIPNKINFYPYTIFDNGHMVPKADIIDCSTNIIENIIPQYRNFNQGIWKYLEAFIHNKYLYYNILTIPEYDMNNFIILKNRIIHIPIGFYKIVINNSSKIVYNIFLEHNNNKTKNFTHYGDFTKIPYFIKIK